MTGAMCCELGPHYVDMYDDSKKTKNLEDAMYRFGKTGGDVDDGSVNSAFYSNDEDDSNLDETNKKRMMCLRRRKNIMNRGD